MVRWHLGHYRASWRIMDGTETVQRQAFSSGSSLKLTRASPKIPKHPKLCPTKTSAGLVPWKVNAATCVWQASRQLQSNNSIIENLWSSGWTCREGVGHTGSAPKTQLTVSLLDEKRAAAGIRSIAEQANPRDISCTFLHYYVTISCYMFVNNLVSHKDMCLPTKKDWSDDVVI